MRSTCLANTSAIIPAAGRGQRMGGQGNKLFLELAGTPVLVFTLKTFASAPSIKEIVIPAAAHDIPVIQEMVDRYQIAKIAAIVEGGKERQDSVWKALQALQKETKKVVVHDGARPLLALTQLNTFLDEAFAHEAAIMAVPVKDTIKRTNDENWVVETPRREQLRMVQTPQFFDRQLLEKVHRLAAEQAYHSTDDAALVEWQGYPVKVLEGSYENIKVTTPEDLLLAEAILKKRGGLLP